MAKLIVLAFTIAVLLAFASAHRTIVTTTMEDDINPTSRKQQCSQHLQGQQFRQCQTYLQQPEQTPYGQQPQQQQTLQQCCQELRNVDQACQCKAVKQVFGEVQQQQQQQGGAFGSPQQIQQQLKQKAQFLPNQCNLQTRKQCNIKTSQQCRMEVQGQQLNRCQRYLEQQTGSGYLRSAVWRSQQEPQGMEECCEELRNVDVECQCEAMKELFSHTQQEQHQHQQQQQQMGEMRRVVQNLENQCNLQVQQCQIQSAMF